MAIFWVIVRIRRCKKFKITYLAYLGLFFYMNWIIITLVEQKVYFHFSQRNFFSLWTASICRFFEFRVWNCLLHSSQINFFPTFFDMFLSPYSNSWSYHFPWWSVDKICIANMTHCSNWNWRLHFESSSTFSSVDISSCINLDLERKENIE